ncbi:MAG: hypothetical protein GY856_39470 [bacterium]|nr:hypothetical protein [bacterium]
MSRFVASSLLGALLLAAPSGLGAAEENPPFVPLRGNLVDRIVAVVDEDPIFLSDVERTIVLGLVTAEDDESVRALERRVLDGLIVQRLRLHEVDRYDSGPLPAEEIDRQLEGIRARVPDDAEWSARLAELGPDGEGLLRHLVTRQLRVLRYVEQRLGPRVFVDLDDIRTCYETELAAELARRNIPVPPMEEVREEIRTLLRERRLNEEIEAWTEELRLEADIVDYFDRADEELPPIVRRIESPS